jgi:cytochrome bd-type quinol oxidase subunit 1
VYLVFGPTYSGCQSPVITASGAVIGREVCRQASMWELQGLSGFPAPYLFIAVWSLAPILGFTAAWFVREHGRRLWLSGIALAIEASVVISFGAAPFYLPLVFPLVLITFLALLNIPQPSGSASPSNR